MIRDYRLVSPSLDGVLNDASLVYEGLKRPIELLRMMDGPASKGKASVAKTEEGVSDDSSCEDASHKGKILEQYFHDLYGIFMKKLSYFVIDSETSIGDQVTLQAMLQEMIKVKRLMGKA
jgi:hypothetical protein